MNSAGTVEINIGFFVCACDILAQASYVLLSRLAHSMNNFIKKNMIKAISATEFFAVLGAYDLITTKKPIVCIHNVKFITERKMSQYFLVTDKVFQRGISKT